MVEKVQMMGPAGTMVGVLSLPAEGRAEEDRPALICWNSGLLHRVGPNRLFVGLCRRLADEGFPALRFDLPGLGDSPSSRDTRPREARTVGDVRAALDHLEAQGIASRFVLVGLCSGAHEAHHAAVADPRVVGVVMIDGYAYPTSKFHRIRMGRKVRNPRALIQALGRRLGMGNGASGDHDAVTGLESEFAWEMPPRARVVAELNQLTQRETNLLFFYTAEVHDVYNYAEQLTDMLPGLTGPDRIAHELLSEADHTFSSMRDRGLVVDKMFEWIAAHWPARAATESC